MNIIETVMSLSASGLIVVGTITAVQQGGIFDQALQIRNYELKRCVATYDTGIEFGCKYSDETKSDIENAKLELENWEASDAYKIVNEIKKIK